MCALMLKWHREDPVSEKEMKRNNAIYAHQNNRNPFIDYPELVEYIWGNKKGQTVTISVLDSPYANESPEQGSGVEDTEVTVKARKVLINGQLYIIVEEQMFDITGRKVK
jgi:hypothetical protein